MTKQTDSELRDKLKVFYKEHGITAIGCSEEPECDVAEELLHLITSYATAQKQQWQLEAIKQSVDYFYPDIDAPKTIKKIQVRLTQSQNKITK